MFSHRWSATEASAVRAMLFVGVVSGEHVVRLHRYWGCCSRRCRCRWCRIMRDCDVRFFRCLHCCRCCCCCCCCCWRWWRGWCGWRTSGVCAARVASMLVRYACGNRRCCWLCFQAGGQIEQVVESTQLVELIVANCCCGVASSCGGGGARPPCLGTRSLAFRPSGGGRGRGRDTDESVAGGVDERLPIEVALEESELVVDELTGALEERVDELHIDRVEFVILLSLFASCWRCWHRFCCLLLIVFIWWWRLAAAAATLVRHRCRHHHHHLAAAATAAAAAAYSLSACACFNFFFLVVSVAVCVCVCVRLDLQSRLLVVKEFIRARALSLYIYYYYLHACKYVHAYLVYWSAFLLLILLLEHKKRAASPFVSLSSYRTRASLIRNRHRVTMTIECSVCAFCMHAEVEVTRRVAADNSHQTTTTWSSSSCDYLYTYLSLAYQQQQQQQQQMRDRCAFSFWRALEIFFFFFSYVLSLR